MKRLLIRVFKLLMTPFNLLFYDRERGLKRELKFWNAWFRTEGLDWPEDYKRRMDKESYLLPEMEELITLLKGKRIKILDVGSGPITRIGYRSNQDYQIQIKACDPLGKAYKELITRYKVSSPVPVETVKGEDLSDHYGKANFDISCSYNALDHSENPLAIILEMVKVTKPEGYVLLTHSENEARKEFYSGLHRWNFSLDPDNNLVLGSIKKKFQIRNEIEGRLVSNKRIGPLIQTTIHPIRK